MAVTLETIRRNWSIIAAAAVICAATGANRVEMHEVHQQIEEIQGGGNRRVSQLPFRKTSIAVYGEVSRILGWKLQCFSVGVVHEFLIRDELRNQQKNKGVGAD